MAQPGVRHGWRWRARRGLLVAATVGVGLGWVAYAATWFVMVRNTEVGEHEFPAGMSGRTTPREYQGWVVGGGGFEYKRYEQSVPTLSIAGYVDVDYGVRQHIWPLKEQERHWNEVVIGYASRSVPKAGTTGRVRAEDVRVWDFLEGSEPRLVLAMPMRPAFAWRSLWVWQWSRQNGLTVGAPLWPLLVVVTGLLAIPWRRRFRAVRR